MNAGGEPSRCRIPLRPVGLAAAVSQRVNATAPPVSDSDDDDDDDYIDAGPSFQQQQQQQQQPIQDQLMRRQPAIGYAHCVVSEDRILAGFDDDDFIGMAANRLD